jgi:hypothetical protein
MTAGIIIIPAELAQGHPPFDPTLPQRKLLRLIGAGQREALPRGVLHASVATAVGQGVVVKAANRISQLELVRACQEAEWVLYTGAEVQTVKQLLQKLPIGDGAQEKELVETVSRLQQLVSETDVVLLKEEVKALSEQKAELEARMASVEQRAAEQIAAVKAEFEERLVAIQPKLLVPDYARKESKNWNEEHTAASDSFVYAHGGAYGGNLLLTIDGFSHWIAYRNDGNYSGSSTMIPIRRGQKFQATTASSGTPETLVFLPLLA